jgi:hypothetical protein
MKGDRDDPFGKIGRRRKGNWEMGKWKNKTYLQIKANKRNLHG